MLFPEEDAPLLKTWIVKRIEDTSDADSEVLAEYIIALLKHEGSKEEVRKLCEGEIPDFLTEDSAKFLDDVFRAIAYKSYVPGAAPPPVVRAQTTGDAQVGTFGGRAKTGNGPPPASRKRGYADFDAPMENYNPSQGPRPMKNPRWQGPELGAQDGIGQGDYQPMPMPPYDAENPMAAFMDMNRQMQMNWQDPAQPFLNGSHGGRKKRNRRCRDFDTKGYCARGASCNFEHGYDGGFMPPMRAVGEDYNPDDPNVTLAGPQAQKLPQQFSPWSMQPQTQPSRSRGNKRGRGNRRRGGARAPFSMDGPETDTSKSTIVVENIPEEHFTEEEVRTFFSTFGQIEDVSMQPYKRLAVVKFDTWDSASAAYLSPKVIFDNRFVKVFWYRDESQIKPVSETNGKSHSNGAPEDEPFDPEEFARKQEEAQKAYQEKEARRVEIDRQRQELEKKQQDLLERHKAESTKLHSKLLLKNGSSTDNDANPLRAQLALLEQEAKMLGIDPNASPVDDEMSVSSWSTARGSWRGGRVRGRGRGRGGGRGRASFQGVDDRHAAYSRYSLDNRPRRVAISGVDFTDAKKEETLRHFLLNLGEFDSVEPIPERTIVTLRDRKTAEKLTELLNGNMLPGVEGDLSLEYLPNILGSAPAAAQNPAEQQAEPNQGSESGCGWGGGEGGGEGSGLPGKGGVGVGEGLGKGRGTGMVIDAESEEGEIEDDADQQGYGGKTQVEDDDAY